MSLSEIQKKLLQGILVLLIIFACIVVFNSIRDQRLAKKRKKIIEQRSNQSSTTAIREYTPKHQKRLFYTPKWSE